MNTLLKNSFLFASYSIMFIILFFQTALSQNLVTAVIVDNNGIKTELYSLESNSDDFQSYIGSIWNGEGFAIRTKKFTEGGFGIVRCFFFWQIAKVKWENPETITIELKDGSTVNGQTTYGLEFSCKTSFGDFKLKAEDCKSLTIKEFPQKTVREEGGKAGALELRDGEKIQFTNFVIYRSHALELMIKTKRGLATIINRIPLEKISRIDFCEQELANGFGLTLTLFDGSTIAGICGEDPDIKNFDTIFGFTNGSPFLIESPSGLGAFIRVISLKE